MYEHVISGVVANDEKAALDALYEAELGVGVSHDSQGIRVLFDSEPAATVKLTAEAIKEGHGALVLGVDQAGIDADDVDVAVVSWSGSGGDVFDYEITLNGEVWSSGSDSAAPFQISFSTPTVGVYRFEVQKRGTYETGFISVEAV
jgi:hypothetical protein